MKLFVTGHFLIMWVESERPQQSKGHNRYRTSFLSLTVYDLDADDVFISPPGRHVTFIGERRDICGKCIINVSQHSTNPGNDQLRCTVLSQKVMAAIEISDVNVLLDATRRKQTVKVPERLIQFTCLCKIRAAQIVISHAGPCSASHKSEFVWKDGLGMLRRLGGIP